MGEIRSLIVEPFPGSSEAVEEGCLCPILDNDYGQGYHCTDKSQFIVVETCPIHGSKEYQEGKDVGE